MSFRAWMSPTCQDFVFGFVLGFAPGAWRSPPGSPLGGRSPEANKRLARAVWFASPTYYI